MFSSGQGPDRKPRVAVTICPVRLQDPDTAGLVEWFLRVADVEPWGGRLVGVREWPRRGGMLAQAAVVVEAVDLLLSEWAYLPKPKAEPALKPKAPESGRRRRR